ncbi:MAG: tRNA glutamyl-Q(34) synthetase GluQRS [Parvularculaceae bacterium]|nr:tRNA glutamyl-Q(34) synthetase GluQRS [Parvularculaceae bacterium]
MLTTRFAPSPTGFLHLGHAFSALSAATYAAARGGRMLLRIEDIDRTRCRPEFEQAIYEDLAWLGIAWETPVRRQSDHFADYAEALDALRALGVVYRCFRTRTEILDEIARAPHLPAAGPEGPRFVGAPLAADEERSRLAEGAPFAWRLSIVRARAVLGPAYEALSFDAEGEGPNGEAGRIAATPDIFGDVVVARKDAGSSYHLASVHDDALQGVTHVVRGQDLFHAAHLHSLLQALLGYPEPRYVHHRLLTDESGRRLAKRDRAATLRALREAGVGAGEVRRRLGFD